TRGGAAVLRRDDIGSLEQGKCADFAVWGIDGLELGGADDPVAGVVLGGPQRPDLVVVGGETGVPDRALVRGSEGRIAQAQRAEARRFAACPSPSPRPCWTPARVDPPPVSRSSFYTRARAWRAAKPTPTAASVSPTGSTAAPTASSSTHRPRS